MSVIEKNGLLTYVDKSGNSNLLFPVTKADNVDGLHEVATSGQYADLSGVPGNASQSDAGLMSAADKKKLDGIAASAEVNQNAFSNVKIGSTTIAADSKTDTLTIAAGDNITLTPDATNDKITIAANDVTKLPLAGGKMTGDLKFAANNVDRFIWFNHSDDVSRWRAGYLGSGSGDANYFAIQSDKNVAGDFYNALTLSANELNAKFGGNVMPATNNAKTLGTSDLKWKNVYATTFTGALTGNASSATKLATARTVDGVSFNGESNITHYGTCSTAAATAAKTVSLTGFTLATGATVKVKFTVTNSASSPTLNVNSTGAKPIYYKNAAISASYLKANYVYEFVYDGTNYVLVGDIDTNSTYSALTAADATTGTATTGRLITAKVLHDKINEMLPTEATTSEAGLMSANDKAKLDNTNVAYGTCSTAAATAAKVITISGNTNWKLAAGSRITIKFTNTNTAQNPTFNVNSTGAKSVWYNTGVLTTANLSYAGYANRPMDFVYDGTQFVFTGWSVDSNTTYSAMTASEATTGTATTGRIITAKVLHDKITEMLPDPYNLPAAGSALGGVKTGGDVTISNGTITVNDDSHNHVINNVDGLQTALDGKLSLTGGYLTGTLGVKGKYELGSCHNYTNGCLIDINASTSNGMYTIHVTGNSYNGEEIPVNSIYQFYNFASQNTIASYSGIELGSPLGDMKVYHYNGRVYAWFKQSKTYQTLQVTLLASVGNLTSTITNAAAHTSGYTNLTTITPKTIYTKDQINRLFSPLVPYGTLLPENADLNTIDYLKVGTYYSNADATVRTFTNCPTTIAFTMHVISPISTTIDSENVTNTGVYRVRKILDYNGTEYVQYARKGSGTNTYNYGPWTKTATDADLESKAGTYHSHDAATASSAGFVSTGTQTFGGDKTFNGSTTKFKDILPSDSGTYSAGNSSYPFLGMTSRSFYVRPSGNTGDSYGHLRATTLGNTSTVGVTELKLGNNIASGTAQNAKGQIALYGSGTGSTTISSANTSSTSYAVTVPAASGSFALYEASTTDLTAGTSALATGKIYLVYE